MTIPLARISIPTDPDMFNIGNFTLTWHGFLTFIAVATAVFLVGRWAKKEGLVSDAVYSVSVWAIIGGIIGTRILHVIDLWNDVYKDNPGQIVQIWEGGITIWGAILGGFLGGAGYILIRNHAKFIGGWNRVLPMFRLDRAPLPTVGRLADLTTPALLIAMALGRVGDIINGEHISKTTGLPWGFIYTHPKTEALYFANNASSRIATHPAVVYEMLWDLVILAIVWKLRNRLRPYGMLFVLYLSLYSIGKFFIQFLREDKVWAIGLTEAHFVALVVLAITIPLLVAKAQIVRPPTPTVSRSAGAGG